MPVGGAVSASSSTAVAATSTCLFSACNLDWEQGIGSKRLAWRPATIKTRCLIIRPALWLFVVEVTQGWLSYVRVCAVEISGVDVAVACECPACDGKWIVSAIGNWKLNEIECIFSRAQKLMNQSLTAKAQGEKTELRKLKQKTLIYARNMPAMQ